MFFLIGRTFLVAFSAASINEESKKPLAIIRGLSTENCNAEVCHKCEKLKQILYLCVIPGKSF